MLISTNLERTNDKGIKLKNMLKGFQKISRVRKLRYANTRMTYRRRRYIKPIDTNKIIAFAIFSFLLSNKVKYVHIDNIYKIKMSMPNLSVVTVNG